MDRPVKPKLEVADPGLVVCALIASLIGVLFIFDAGYVRSVQKGLGVVPREAWMQIMFLAVSLVAGGVALLVRPQLWSKLATWLWYAGLASLLLVYVPKLGVEMNGAHRWIRVSIIQIQPAEFVKFTTILYLAACFADRVRSRNTKTPAHWFQWLDWVGVPWFKRVWPALIVLIAAVVIEKEPDLGTASIVLMIALAMMLVGGVSPKSIVALVMLLVVGVSFMAWKEPYRLERIVNHASRWTADNVDDSGYQTTQSEHAMASGGMVGVGIGAGRAKHVIPAPTTDFVLATIAEEFGLLGALGVLALIGTMVVRLMLLAKSAPTSFGRLVCAGTGVWIGGQAAINIMMANGTLPAVGIPLPFFSSGGSSLVALWMAIGVSLSVAGMRPAKEAKPEADHNRWGNRRTRLSRA